MDPGEAGQIAEYLVLSFPDAGLEKEHFARFVEEVALLADPAIGMEAAVELARSYPRFPAISEFRAAYHTVAKREHQAREQAQYAALEAATTPEEKARILAEIARFAEELRLRVGGIDDKAYTLEPIDEGPCQDCSHEGERFKPGPGPLLVCRKCAAARIRVAASKDGRAAA